MALQPSGPHSKRPYLFPWRLVVVFGAVLWRVIGWIWSSIILGGLLIGMLASYLVTGTTGLSNPDPRTWFIVRSLFEYPLPTSFGLATALIATAYAYLAHRASQEAKPSQGIGALPSANKNHQRMLARVRSIWITGILERSLQKTVLITLGLEERQDILASPWHFVLRSPHQMAQRLPDDTSITEIYDQCGGELLILGEPGSGKTTLLLELARNLLDRAEHDTDHPIPVVFNLSAWITTKQPFDKWLVEQLKDKYQVPFILGQSWVQNNQILPLLDGLDEVSPESRSGCISAINAYKRERGLLPTVVCSRTTEYLDNTEQLLLQNAVTIQPLTSQQIESYLMNGGQKLAAVRTLLHQDAVLRELVTTPLMLSIVTIAYQGKSIKDLKISSMPETLRHQVISSYIQRVLARSAARTMFTPQQTIYWLTWLAQQLQQHHQSEFYIENLQMDWLPNKHWYRLLSSITIGCIVGLTKTIEFSLFYTVHLGPLHGILNGILIGLFTGILYFLINGLGLFDYRERELTIGRNQGDWRQRFAHVFTELLSYGAIFGSLNGLLAGIFCFPIYGLKYAFIYGLFCGTIVTIEFYLLGRLKLGIQPADTASWSWINVQRNSPKHLIGSLLVGLLGGLILANTFGFISGLVIGCISGLAYGLVSSVVSAVSHTTLEEQRRQRPNQGILDSLHNSIFYGFGLATIIGILIGIIYWITGGPLKALAYGLAFGIGNAEVIGLRIGGAASIQHFILRLCLWYYQCIPWNYSRFLDYAARSILLRKIGGGYIFVHRYLLDYFSSLK